MLGAIIGDLAGSVYEFNQINKACPIKIDRIIEEKAFFSDDTILTVAIADAIMSGESYEKKLKEYGLKYVDYIPKDVPYFEKMFSPGFCKWLNSEVGVQGQSQGNGAMMRISPVGEFFESEEEVLKNAKLATIPSHNSEIAIKCASTIALIIFYARKGKSKEEIIKKLNLKIKKPKIDKFNYFCEDTIDVCLYSVFKANSFEESMKIALSFGGDTDTNACIVGGMAEAFYGLPASLKKEALNRLPDEFVEIIEKFEAKTNENIDNSIIK